MAESQLLELQHSVQRLKHQKVKETTENNQRPAYETHSEMITTFLNWILNDYVWDKTQQRTAAES
jgi:hypothetical protein